MFGYQNDAEVIGHPIQAFSHGDSQEAAIITTVIDSLMMKGSWSGEVTPRRRDGTFYAFLSAWLVKDTLGIPFCMMASFADVTDLKKAQEEIQPRILRLRQLSTRLHL